MVAKLSSSSTMCGRLARNVGADLAHRDTDVRTFQRGRVVDAVAGHRNELAAALQRPNDADLLFRVDARIDAQMAAARTASSWSSSCPSSRPVIRRSSSSSAMPSRIAMARAVRGWSPVIITGDDARLPALGDRAFGASGRGGSMRPTKPTKVSSALDGRGCELVGHDRPVAPCDGKHAQTIAAPSGRPARSVPRHRSARRPVAASRPCSARRRAPARPW